MFIINVPKQCQRSGRFYRRSPRRKFHAGRGRAWGRTACSDSTGAQAIIDAIQQTLTLVKHLFADAAYNPLKLMDKAAYLAFVVEIIRRRDGAQDFEVLPHRWVVERTFGWMIRWRRLVRDYSAASTSQRP